MRIKPFGGQSARIKSVYSGPVLPHDARLHAWSIIAGEPLRSAESGRRPHRGMLPDVDFTGVSYRGPSLFARLLGFVGLAAGDPEAEQPEEDHGMPANPPVRAIPLPAAAIAAPHGRDAVHPKARAA